MKNLISGGYINSFREIFDIIPKTVVARDLGINNIRFTKLMDNVDKFMMRDLFRIADFLEIDEAVILKLVLQQYVTKKQSKKKK